jgi:hypothetical protein
MLLFTLFFCLVAAQATSFSDEIPFDLTDADLGVAPSRNDLLRILREAATTKEEDILKAEAELLKQRQKVHACADFGRQLKFRSFVVMDCELKK